MNEAARLCDLAQNTDGRVVASRPAVDRAGSEEQSRWQPGEVVTLRGRPEPTQTMVPRPGGPSDR